MAKPLPDPSRRLRKETYEKFAQARAASKILSHAWAEATGVNATAKNDLALRVSGKRVADRPEVAARIAFLIEDKKRRKADETDAIDVPDVIDRTAILEICLEVTRALESCHAKLLDSNIPEIRVRQFYSILASHLSRQQKLISTGVEILEDTSPRDAAAERFNRVFASAQPNGGSDDT